MKQIQRKLMGLFVTTTVVPLVLVFLFETEILGTGLLAGDSQSEFVFSAIMELVSLGSAFLSLRLFKFAKVHSDLVANKEAALKKWGIFRLAIILIPLWSDTILYYLYMNPTFGYLAIILALCLPFVYPSLGRCVAETSEEK